MPKIFKDDMVLQAGSKDHPVRTIWGFLDGVSSKVELIGLCDLPDGTSLDYADEFVPKPVSVKDTNILEENYYNQNFLGNGL